MIKKILCLMLSLIMVISLVACGNNTTPTTEPVETTTPTESTEPTDTTPTEPEAEKLSSTLSLDTDVSNYVTLGQYVGIEYAPATWEVTDKDVEETMKTAFPEYPQVKEGKVEDGDNININFVGYVDGVEDPNCTYTNEAGYDLTIGSNALIEGFESGLIGKELGSTVELNLTFPEDYHEDYKGKAVKFDVTINYKTGDVVYPELTDELIAEKTNGEQKTVEEYREYTRENMEKAAKADAQNKDIAAVIDAVIANATFAELPQEEIDFYNEYSLAQNQSYANMFGMSLNDWLSQMMGTSVEKFAEYNKENAENYVKNKLVMIAICQAEKKVMTDEEFEARLTADMEAYGYDNLATFKADIETQDSLENWKTSYVLNDLQDWVVSQAVVKNAE